jgi:hypothetical protein
MPDFDELLHALAMVDEQLLELSDDAIEQRAMLHDRQHELRALLHILVPTYDVIRSTASLRTELANIEERLRAIEEQEVNVAEKGQDGGSLIGDRLDITDIDKRIEEGQGVPELRDRMMHLRRLLDEREATRNRPVPIR